MESIIKPSSFWRDYLTYLLENFTIKDFLTFSIGIWSFLQKTYSSQVRLTFPISKLQTQFISRVFDEFSLIFDSKCFDFV
jgi:hypothetical protein